MEVRVKREICASELKPSANTGRILEFKPSQPVVAKTGVPRAMVMRMPR